MNCYCADKTGIEHLLEAASQVEKPVNEPVSTNKLYAIKQDNDRQSDINKKEQISVINNFSYFKFFG